MFRKTVVLGAFLVFFSNAFAQRILYVFPDKVEKALADYIYSMRDDKYRRFYFTLYKSGNLYTIYVSSYYSKQDPLTQSWIKASNRIALVNKNKYPILFEEDYTFATPDSTNVGEYGNRNGYVKRLAVINEGYSVQFTKSAEIVK